MIEPKEEPAGDPPTDLPIGRFGRSPQMLEALYYASEDDLMVIMRLIAALDPPFRARVLDYATTLRDQQKRSEAS